MERGIAGEASAHRVVKAARGDAVWPFFCLPGFAFDRCHASDFDAEVVALAANGGGAVAVREARATGLLLEFHALTVAHQNGGAVGG